MRIAIMGAGAAGCYYGAKLAKAGERVVFIARGSQLHALQGGGLHVRGEEHFSLPMVRATNDTLAVGLVDVVLFSVKTFDTEEAARLILPMVGPTTMVVPIQNGVESAERLGRVVGPEQVVGGFCRLWAEVTIPGTVQVNSDLRDLTFGELNGTASLRTEAFARALAKADIPYRLTPSIQRDQWQEFAMAVALSGISGATRSTVGEIRDCAETLELYARLASEVVEVGRAEGIELDPALPVELVEELRTFPTGFRTTLLQDLQRGGRTELEAMQGLVIRLGRKHRIPTPVAEVIYGLLKLHHPR